MLIWCPRSRSRTFTSMLNDFLNSFSGCKTMPPNGNEAFMKQLYHALDWRRVPVQVGAVARRVFIEFRPDSTGPRCRVVLRKGSGPPYDSPAMTAARQVASLLPFRPLASLDLDGTFKLHGR